MLSNFGVKDYSNSFQIVCLELREVGSLIGSSACEEWWVRT